MITLCRQSLSPFSYLYCNQELFLLERLGKENVPKVHLSISQSLLNESSSLVEAE